MNIPAIFKSSIPNAVLKEKGDLATVMDDGQLDTMPVGPDGTVLTADSTQPAGFKWGSPPNLTISWGNISGTLSNQTDLEDALNGKQDALGFTPVPNTTKVNSHSLTANVTLSNSDIGLGNVSNDSQLKRSAKDFSSFTQKATPVAGDVLLLEDSTDSGAKKFCTIGSLPTGTGPGGLTSILKGTGSNNFTTAEAGKDYLAPDGSAAALTDFPILNQNTTGTAANLSGTPTLPNGTAATTQPQADNSTRLATTAYVDTGLAGKLSPTGDGCSLTGLTAAQVGLGKVTNDTQEILANKNQPNGYCGLDSAGKVAVAQLPASILGSLSYQGTFDASGGSYPANPSKGYYWVISVQGTLGGVVYGVNDWLTYDGTNWDKIDNSVAVSSVAGKTGAVVLTSADVGLANVTNDAQIKASDFPSSVTDGQAALFNGNDGKSLKAAFLTGIIKQTSGVPSVATPKTDYAPPTSGSSILKGDGLGGFASAISGTDFLAPTGNGSQLTGITPSQVGLGNVTNDTQLKAAAGDFASFPEKTSPVSADLLLIEDSAASGAKKKVQVGNLPGGGGLPAQTGHAGQFLTTDGSTTNWGTPSVGSADWKAITSKPEITIGDSGFGSSIQDALTAVGSKETTVIVPPGNYTVTAAIPSNVTLRFARGALLTSGVLTIDGELQAGDYKILNGGTLVIGSTCRNQFVNPRWWGALGDDDGVGGGTDDYAALSAMITALGTVPMVVKLFPGKYKIGSDITFPATAHLDFMKGAMLAPHLSDTQATTITNTDVAITPTITYAPSTYGSNVIVPSASLWNYGVREGVSYLIEPTTGQRFMVGKFNNYFTMGTKLLDSISTPFTGASCKMSSRAIIFSGSVTLEIGDKLWISGDSTMHRVGAVVNSTQVNLVNHPAESFETATSWKLGIRAKIAGTFSSCGLCQVFTGKGAVKLTGPIGKLYCEWWGGGVTSAAAANDDAIESALWSTLSRAPLLQFSLGTYSVGRAIVLSDGSAIRGMGDAFFSSGNSLTRIIKTNHCNRFAVVDFKAGRNSGNHGLSITELQFDARNCTQDFPITCIQISDVDFARVERNSIVGFDWGININGKGQQKVSENFIGCINGIFCYGFDSFFTENNIGCGLQLIHNYDFSSYGKWFVNGSELLDGNVRNGWAINTAAKEITHSSGTGNTYALSQTVSNSYDGTYGTFYPLTRGQYYGLHITVSDYAGGSVTFSVGGLSRTLTQNGTYFYAFISSCSGDITFTPTADFVGSLSLINVTYGYGIDASLGGDGVIADNIVYGDGGSVCGLFSPGTWMVQGNRFDHTDVGVLCHRGSAHIIGNFFERIGRFGFWDDNAVFGPHQIRDNFFDYVGASPAGFNYFNQYGTYTAAAAICLSGKYENGIIKGNIITGNCLNKITSAAAYTDAGASPGLIEKNFGVDVNGGPLVMTGATPSVWNGKYWKTNNSGAVTITDFKNGCTGKEIHIRFGDSATTLDFANTSGASTLKGNKGVNVTVAAGDTLRAVKGDDGNWYCEYFDNTP